MKLYEEKRELEQQISVLERSGDLAAHNIAARKHIEALKELGVSRQTTAFDEGTYVQRLLEQHIRGNDEFCEKERLSC